MAVKTKIIVEIGENENSKLYTLEYDRQGIEYLEKVLKFNILEYSQSYITSSVQVWKGAFQKHHKDLTIEEREALYDQYRDEGGDLSEVIDFLGERITAFAPTTQSNTKKKKKAIIE